MYLTLELDREADGRYIAEVPDVPGVLAYGASQPEAVARAQALVLRVLADRLEHGEPAPDLLPLDFARRRPRPEPRRTGRADAGVSRWPAAKARRVLAALLRIGWAIKREAGRRTSLPPRSLRTQSRPGAERVAGAPIVDPRRTQPCPVPGPV